MVSGCAEQAVNPAELPSRESRIPADAVKMTPDTDLNLPVLHSDEFEKPVPFAPVNTAGAEDSPFMPADRDEFYFFFTPDVRVPVEKQILDGVTGIWVSKKQDGTWQEPERVMLQKPGKLAGDGCEFVAGNTMWFCTAREGYTGMHWARAEYKDGRWQNWKVDDFPPEYQVGELHFTRDWNEVYFHSKRAGGRGQEDIWVMQKKDGKWQEPKNVEVVNTESSDGWPYLTPDGNELWFNRFYKGTPAVFRSKKIDGEWQAPELIVEMFAGEPTLDNEGNLYFVHHYYDNGVMLEADIYVAYRK
ncbi:MAG: hypothetical protein KKD17_04020 [Nanoarchaeota archaeon]|nr:hypothetical protein [Nanoarchaeota archaeon]